MSGGVDSSVAAWLMKRDGFDCSCAYMKLHILAADSDSDARAAAGRLDIPYYVFDFSEVFKSKVVNRFIETYREGRTPNPCVDCNNNVKFGSFQENAMRLGMDFIATGHYARVEYSAGGRYLLKKGLDKSKDQSYVLYLLSQKQLSLTKFPLGAFSKNQVREFALDIGLENAQKRESQDICFVPGGDYVSFIEKSVGKPASKGRFTDTEGRDLGENKGIINYTIGQRRGLGLAMPYPPYVLELNASENIVVVGRNEELFSKTLIAHNINLIPFDRLENSLRAYVKIRYNQREQPATVHQTDADTLRIEFDEPQRAIAKGQAAVIYDGDVIIGGGTIS